MSSYFEPFKAENFSLGGNHALYLMIFALAYLYLAESVTHSAELGGQGFRTVTKRYSSLNAAMSLSSIFSSVSAK